MHMKSWALLASAWLAVLAGGACDDQTSPPPVQYDASRVRRLFRPPEGEVRAVPPHAIHSQGVGPYVLGTSLKEILGLLPRGPRVMLMQIDGVLDYSLVRAEGDTLLIGVEPPSGVTFLSVLGEETARTESGMGVGTSVEALRKALGPELVRPERAADPRLLAFVRLPNTRFLLDEPGGQVVAVVVRHDDDAGPATGQAGPGPGQTAGHAPGHASGQPAGHAPGQTGEPAREGSAPASCPVSEARALDAGDDELQQIRAAAELVASPAEAPDPAVVATVRRACFSASEAEVLVVGADQVAVVGGEPGKLRRLAGHAEPGLVYAAPLDVDGDGRSEIVVVSQRVTEEERVTAVQLLRFEAGRLQRVAAEDVYRVSATNAAWVGARLEDVELVIEVRGELEALQLTGLYVHRGKTRPQTVAPLMKAALLVRRGKRSALGPVPGPELGTPPVGTPAVGTPAESTPAVGAPALAPVGARPAGARVATGDQDDPAMAPAPEGSPEGPGGDGPAGDDEGVDGSGGGSYGKTAGGGAGSGADAAVRR